MLIFPLRRNLRSSFATIHNFFMVFFGLLIFFLWLLSLSRHFFCILFCTLVLTKYTWGLLSLLLRCCTVEVVVVVAAADAVVAILSVQILNLQANLQVVC